MTIELGASVPSEDEEFNPFLDDNDSLEDSVFSEREDYVARPENLFYAPTPPRPLTPEEIAEEMPPYGELDWEAEIDRIIQEREYYEGLVLPARLVIPEFNSEDSLPLTLDENNLSLPETATPASADEDDFDLDNLLSQLDLGDDEIVSESVDSSANEIISLAEDDWGFSLEEDEVVESVPVPDDWGFSDVEETPVNQPSLVSEEDDFSLDDLDLDFDLAEELEGNSQSFSEPNVEDFEPPENPFATIPDDDSSPSPTGASPASADEDSEHSGGIKNKINKLIAQIKAELRGGDADDTPQAPAADDDDDTPSSSGGANIFSKIFFPFIFVMNFFAKILKAGLNILGGIPVIGKIFTKLASLDKLINILALLVPIAIILGGLYYHGSTKFVSTNDTVTFPDNGEASIEIVSTTSTSVKYKIKNGGDVVAEVTPTVIIYGTKISANPLTLFYPEKLATCVGDTVQINIDETRELEIDCKTTGYRQIASGEIKW